MRKLLIAVPLLVFIATVARAQSKTRKIAEQKMLDIAYGTFPSCKMDVFLPGDRNDQTPFVILIHGGSWISGDKSGETPTQDSLLAHGIASASINYRFIDSLHTHYSELLADIDSAVNYCVAHAGLWKTRKDRFVTDGGSAGGHLALLYGYTTPRKISAIVALCPPTDLADTNVLNYVMTAGLLPLIEKLTNDPYTPGQAVAAGFFKSSPIYQVKDIPTLLVHGTADGTVSFTQSEKLDSVLKSKKIIHKLVPISGADHNLNLQNPVTRAMVYREMISWILKYGR